MNNNIPDPYLLSDETIKKLNKKAVLRASKAKRKLTIANFDELNVIKTVEELYRDLLEDAKTEFCNLYLERYIELLRWFTSTRNVRDAFGKINVDYDDFVDQYVELAVFDIIDDPNWSTHYIYSMENVRKRDRLIEAIESVNGKTAKQAEIDKGIRIYSQMNTWYSDFVSQEAEIQLYKDAGVKRVKRIEKKDSRVCDVCKQADGEVYRIDKVPPIPHLNCRRKLIPYDRR